MENITEDVDEFNEMFKEMDLAEEHKDICKDNLKMRFNTFQDILRQYLFRYRNDNSTKSLHDLLIINYDKPNIIIPYDRSIRIAVKRYHQSFYETKEAKKKFNIIQKKNYQLRNITADKFKGWFNKISDSEKREHYLKLHAKFFKNRRIYGTKIPSKGESSIKKFLDIITDKYDFYYFYSCRWDFCKDKKELEYDFYCCLFYENRFIHWVIECDGKQHRIKNNLFNFVSNHQHDIMKQNYLLWLNIPLLRIDDNDPNIGISVVNFINDILVSTKYVIHKQITPISKYFQDRKQNLGIVNFNKYYLEMHNKCIIIRKNKLIPVNRIFDVYDFVHFYEIKENPVKQTNVANTVLESDDDDVVEPNKRRPRKKCSVIIL